MIAFISDLHLGNIYANKKETEEHSYNALAKIEEKLLEYQPDLVLVGGDIFDKNKVSGKEIGVFIDFINKMNKNNIGVVSISGNHDGKYWLKESFDHAIPYILYKSGINPENGYEYYSFAGIYLKNSRDWKTLSMIEDKYDISIVGFSFYTKDRLPELYEYLSIIDREKSDYILLMHQSLKSLLPQDPAAIDLTIENYKYALFGHMHMKYYKDKIIVTPPPYSISLKEANTEKGFWLIDKKPVFVPIEDSRPFIKMAIDLDNPIEIKPNKNAILILDVYYRESQIDKLNLLKKTLSENFLYVKINPILKETSKIIVKKSENKEEIFKKYLKEDYDFFMELYEKFRDIKDPETIVQYLEFFYR
ncbi:NEQ383 [Nanoarchaeum equitans Kin4-M]|uniref:DNA double-strand break repair protein Mre11 n=1 Tax=Nanoarchaeum equitans (strain Kin4-M) TaxID=228908 RepID=MRE11_NANEQ|nr:RecName: Full=DNA double-strand break repair protein Mre11 [Nanoarchaeum equitans Kin4-M]AAR39230.1 NEQ383 [Nanoarchaeum equitans Kin4-M]